MYVGARRLLEAVLEDEDGGAFRLFWAERKPPALAVSLAQPDQVVLARPAPLYRALDEQLVKVARVAPGGEALDEAQQRAYTFERLRRELFGAVGGADWPPRTPATWTRGRMPMALRIDFVRAFLADLLVPVLTLADDRLHVLRLWNNPAASSVREDGRDTARSLVDELLGEASGVFRTADEPSRTPMRDSHIALLGEPYVSRAGGEPLALALEEDMRAGASNAARAYAPATEAYLGEFADRALFEEHPRAQAARITAGIVDRAARYERTFTALRRYAREGAFQRLGRYTELEAFRIGHGERPAVVLGTREELDASKPPPRLPFALLDERLLRAIAEDAPNRLRKTDVFAPRPTARTLGAELDATYAQAYLRRAMEAEQSAATGALVELRDALAVELGVWRERLASLLRLPDSIDRALKSVVPAGTTPRVTDEWADRFTNARHESWRTEALTRLMPAPLRNRIAAYEALYEEHLKALAPYTRDLADETSASLAVPSEALVRRALKLYAACVAVRDAVLPLVGDAAKLVARLDSLFGAHLAYVAKYAASAKVDWQRAWRGTLSDGVVAALLKDMTLDVWFSAAESKRLLDVDKLRAVPSLPEQREWAPPVRHWYEWLMEGDVDDADALDDGEAAKFVPSEVPLTTLPVVSADEVPSAISSAPVTADERIAASGAVGRIVDEYLAETRATFDRSTRIGKALLAEATRAFAGRLYAPLYDDSGAVKRALDRLEDIDDDVRRIAAQFGAPAPAKPKKPADAEFRATADSVTKAVLALVGAERKRR